jgi:hypothetical protein
MTLYCQLSMRDLESCCPERKTLPRRKKLAIIDQKFAISQKIERKIQIRQGKTDLLVLFGVATTATATATIVKIGGWQF